MKVEHDRRMMSRLRVTRRIRATVLCLVLLSCHQSSPVSDREEAYLRARCERELRCGSFVTSFELGDVETCVQYRRAQTPTYFEMIEFALENGFAELDEAAFDQYLRELSQSDCSELPMIRFLVGLGQTGEECTRSWQCESGWCDGCPGVCSQRPEPGDVCDAGDMLSCGGGLVCSEGRCLDPNELDIPEGGYCELFTASGLAGMSLLGNPCGEDLFCDTSSMTCRPYALEGERASNDGLTGGCEPGLIVDSHGVCRRRELMSDVDGFCDNLRYVCDLSRGLVCQIDDGLGTCQRAPTEGMWCEDRDPSGEPTRYRSCDPRQPLSCGGDGICHARKSFGESCEINGECRSRSCDPERSICMEPDFVTCGSEAVQAGSGG